MTNDTRSPVPLQRTVLAAAGLWVVWLALVGSADPVELATGVLVAFAATLMAGANLSQLDAVRLRPALPMHLLHYFVRFGRALLVANLDVARRVATPGPVRINPAVVDIHTDLKSDLGRLWLANSITLTPGTLTVDVEGEMLHVHWIDAPPGLDLKSATRAIAAEFEAVLREIVQ
ncbi:MAG: Na+/H+ antiporter subunit E [Hyphomicrobiaceae bacterium]|nr:Na+/H+ antiporter subunit E [Hyphomicrobiaceae bacterium]